MNAYLDLSYIFHLLLCISGARFSKTISNTSFSRKKLIFFEITSMSIYLNVLIFSEVSYYLNILYYLIVFLFLYKKNFFIPLISFVFSYYSQIAIIMIFTNGIYLYKGALMIHNPLGFFYVLICPLLLFVVDIITRSIKALVMLKKYKYSVKLNIRGKSYTTNAYFDSGNTLKFKDLPVVFLTEELKDKNVNYEKLLIDGIGKSSSDYLKGSIIFDNREKEVYFAYVKKKSFNGCNCLLNVYLLG